MRPWRERAKLIELYGLTEGIITTLDPEDLETHAASVGKPAPGFRPSGREFLGTSLTVSIALFGPGARAAPAAGTPAAPLPRRERVRVAFMLGDNANVIDTAGPWEVFQDVMVHDGGHRHPFQLYTVAPTEEMLRMTGGLQVVLHYSNANAPQPEVIVVPAHRSTDESRAWLTAASAGTDVTMPVCTGAFQLARAGLL